MSKKALLIIDMQNDFCPGGALEIPDGDNIIPIINKISMRFYKVIATQDWHPEKHVSFASTYNKEPFQSIKIGDNVQKLWPDHCVKGTPGAQFHKALDLNPVDLIIRKGIHTEIDSYSAFLENDKQTQTGLQHYLKGLNIKDVYICGLATDYCVYFSALDSYNLGFETTVILDATRGVNVPDDNVKKTVQNMNDKGIHIIKHTEI